MADAISWASRAVGSPWEHVSASMKVEFDHVLRRANDMADNLDKEGCDVGLYFSCYGNFLGFLGGVVCIGYNSLVPVLSLFLLFCSLYFLILLSKKM